MRREHLADRIGGATVRKRRASLLRVSCQPTRREARLRPPLRGSLPEQQARMTPPLDILAQATMKRRPTPPRVFISYASEDADAARVVREALGAEAECWFAPEHASRSGDITE